VRSIRLSLIVYFLLLLAAALGASGWLVYRTADEKLNAEQMTNYRLLATQYEDQTTAIKARLDQDLLSQARTVAQLAQVQPQFRRLEVAQFMPVGALSAALAPQGNLLIPTWIASGTRSPLNLQLLRRLATEIVVVDEELPRDPAVGQIEYFQINSEWSSVPSWRSRSLGDHVLPFDPARLSSTQSVDWVFDDVPTPTGTMGRRVQFKVPVTRFRFFRPVGPPPGSNGEGLPPVQMTPGRPPDVRAFLGRGDRVTESLMPYVVIQCVSETDRRDADLYQLNLAATAEMEAVLGEGAETRQKLTRRLLLIGAATFLASALGGLLIINMGLRPLRDLGDAVGRISPSDFRLSLPDEPLPNELEPIERRLRGTLDQLRAAFDREKQAVADISHELRTPVAALLATIDVTLRKPRQAEEYRKALVEARAAGNHLRTLVERLLALARIDAGVVQARIAPCPVAEIVDQVATLIRPLATEKSLTLNVDCRADLVWATDADKVREVLINLLHNAVQYNQPGGRIELAAEIADGRLVLDVRDTGIGIAPDQLPHLFERFYRVDPSREEAALHAGLGLAIVRGYIDLLGGEIRVENNPGGGSVFRVVLPPGRITRREAA
jgi:signal transduction histidine kinase